MSPDAQTQKGNEQDKSRFRGCGRPPPSADRHRDNLILRLDDPIIRSALAVFALVLTFANDGLMEFVADRFGKGINVVVAVDFDGFLGCIANHEAVMAPLEMLFQLRLKLDVNISVQVLVKFFKEVFALHCGFAPSLLFFWK